jgi:hypothetical protein
MSLPPGKLALVLSLLAVLLPLIGCDKAASPAEDKLSRVLDVKARSVTPRSGDYVLVAYTVTNRSEVGVVRAKVLITVLDADGADLGSRKTYVVRGAAGGLAPGASLDDEVLVSVKDKARAAGARFELDYIRDATGAKIGVDDEAPVPGK